MIVMSQTVIRQSVDFLSIALEEMEKENYEVAQDFVEDVMGDLQEELED